MTWGERTIVAHRSSLNITSADPLKAERRKVAILGMVPNTAIAAPLEEPEWEVWACNHMFPKDVWGSFRADRWFELHPRAVCDDERAVINNPCAVIYVAFKREWPGYAWPNDGRVVEFPRDLARRQGQHPNFASTFSWQVALALALGFEEIGVFGIELVMGREGLFEKASLAYWLGVAEGRGVKVTIPPGSWTLWHPADYGFNYWQELERVGQIARLVQPTIRRVPERPSGRRPKRSHAAQRRARKLWPQMGPSSST